MRNVATLGILSILAVAVVGDHGVAQNAAQPIRMAIQSHPNAGQKCLEIAGAQFVAGMRLQMRDCGYKSDEIFAYEEGAQRLVIGHLCVEAWGQGGEDDAIGLGACTGAPNQRWRMNASGDYYQVVGPNNLCLALRKGDKNNGAALQIARCNPQPDQLWALIQPPSAEAPKCNVIVRWAFWDLCNGCTKPPREQTVRRTKDGWAVQFIDPDGNAINFTPYHSVSENESELIMYDQTRDLQARFDLFGRKTYLRKGNSGDWTPIADILRTDC